MHRSVVLLLICPAACFQDVPQTPVVTVSSDGGDTSSGGQSEAESGPDSTTSGSTTGEDTDGTTGGLDSSSGSSEGESSSGGPGCGDGMVGEDEECDGEDLAGADCTTLKMGFAGGRLGCGTDCMFDVSGCSTCGNGQLDRAEVCDGEDLGEMGCRDVGFTGGVLSCTARCAHDTTACTDLPRPAAGEVVITEIMQNPLVLPDSDGEWFEVFNLTPATDLQLGGCRVEGNVFDPGFLIATDVVIPAQGYVVFATDTDIDPGVVAAYSWPEVEFGLTNASDSVSIVCDGVVIDEVSYDDGRTFPDPAGQSMSLDPAAYDSTLNDTGGLWCLGTTSYNGDFGSPGADNPDCAPV